MKNAIEFVSNLAVVVIKKTTMRKIHLLTTFAILFLANVSLGQFANNNDLINQAILIEDYDYMLKTLEKTHPNLYAYIPKAEFLNDTDKVMNYTYWLIDEEIKN